MIFRRILNNVASPLSTRVPIHKDVFLSLIDSESVKLCVFAWLPTGPWASPGTRLYVRGALSYAQDSSSCFPVSNLGTKAWFPLDLQIEQVSQLSALVQAQLEYHKQAVQILQQVTVRLEERYSTVPCILHLHFLAIKWCGKKWKSEREYIWRKTSAKITADPTRAPWGSFVLLLFSRMLCFTFWHWI